MEESRKTRSKLEQHLLSADEATDLSGASDCDICVQKTSAGPLVKARTKQDGTALANGV